MNWSRSSPARVRSSGATSAGPPSLSTREWAPSTLNSRLRIGSPSTSQSSRSKTGIEDARSSAALYSQPRGLSDLRRLAHAEAAGKSRAFCRRGTKLMSEKRPQASFSNGLGPLLLSGLLLTLPLAASGKNVKPDPDGLAPQDVKDLHYGDV